MIYGQNRNIAKLCEASNEYPQFSSRILHITEEVSLTRSRDKSSLGTISFIGALLLGVATLFHPITIDPWQEASNLQKIYAVLPIWPWDHAALTVAFSLWLCGLSGADAAIHSDSAFAKVASRLFMASLAIWMVILADELGIIPPVVNMLQNNPNTILSLMGGVLFGFALIAGYFAMALVWAGVALLSWTMHIQERNWLSRWGIGGGIVGILGMVYSLLWPATALYILACTSIIPYTWTIIFAWKLMRSKYTHI